MTIPSFFQMTREGTECDYCVASFLVNMTREMENHNATDQEFACEDCGFTSPLTDDVCPNCSGRMVALDGPPKRAANSEADEAGLTDESSSGESEDGGALSLERLQEEESRDDYQEDYGDGDE